MIIIASHVYVLASVWWELFSACASVAFNEYLWDFPLQSVSNVASACEDFNPGICLISLSIEVKYRVVHMKIPTFSSSSLCSKCVNATVIVCKITTILSDIHKKHKTSM